MRLGVHVSISGKIYEAVERARGLGCETMQIFSRNPRGWQASKLNEVDADEFKRRRKIFGIWPITVHLPYLVNLASPKKELYRRSIQAFIEDIKRAEILGAEYFVTHLGSHRGSGELSGIKRFSQALNIIIEETNPKIKILLENTAGAGDSLGYNFRQIRDIIARVKTKELLGLCFDTCHAFAAGYNIAEKEGLNKTIQEIEKFLGKESLWIIHLNDSKSSLGSRVDRHQHIGKGKIGKKGFRNILTHTKLKDSIFILETPKDSPGADKRNMTLVRRLADFHTCRIFQPTRLTELSTA